MEVHLEMLLLEVLVLEETPEMSHKQVEILNLVEVEEVDGMVEQEVMVILQVLVVQIIV